MIYLHSRIIYIYISPGKRLFLHKINKTPNEEIYVEILSVRLSRLYDQDVITCDVSWGIPRILEDAQGPVGRKGDEGI